MRAWLACSAGGVESPGDLWFVEAGVPGGDAPVAQDFLYWLKSGLAFTLPLLGQPGPGPP